MNMSPIVKLVQSADGTAIYTDAIGDPTNLALVFVHGFSSSAGFFNDIFANPENSKEFYQVSLWNLEASNVNRPIFVGWSMGGRSLADNASFLLQDTLLGAVCLAGVPYFDPKPKMQSVTSTAMGSFIPALLSEDNALAMQRTLIAANRLLFLKDPNPSTNFLVETMKAIAGGTDFADQNRAVSWQTRCAFVAMEVHMSPTDRRLAVSLEQDNAKVIELAKSGFPLHVVHGTHDMYISGEKMFEVIRPNFVNLRVMMIDGGSHVAFLESPNEAMVAIFEFCKELGDE